MMDETVLWASGGPFPSSFMGDGTGKQRDKLIRSSFDRLWVPKRDYSTVWADQGVHIPNLAGRVFLFIGGLLGRWVYEKSY